MFENKRIMIVVAHPDDELLGLGATMHKLIQNNNVITRVVILGEGIAARTEHNNCDEIKDILAKHHSNIDNARKIIGYGSVSTYGFSDNRFDHHDLLDIIKVVEKEKERFKPDVIFTHHGGDLNVDHQQTFKAVMTACRPMEDECVKTIITFETPSATEWQANIPGVQFMPNLFIEINKEDLQAKIVALKAYEFEIRKYPHPRSENALEFLASTHGYMVGIKYAEAFQIIRTIIK